MRRLPPHSLISRLARLAALASCMFVAANRTTVADDAPGMSPYVGTLSCSSVSCHGRTEARHIAGTTARNEFVTWSHLDPHARAAATIASPQFHDILVRLGAVRDGEWNLAVYARCARCHDPQHESLVPTTHRALGKINPRGIGCESCHGPAEKWLAKHFERNVTPGDLATLGMIRTKDLATRGQMCADCHVGSADHDLNHDLIAAGHPALRFELVSYHDQLAKHWDDAGERLAMPDFAAQLWAVGQLAGAGATLQLSRARASRAAEQPAESSADAAALGLAPLWPEFAEYNCLACHQSLHSSSAASPPAHPRSRVGLPAWSEWHFALTGALLAQLDARDAKTPLALSQLRERMVTASPFGEINSVQPLADDVTRALTAAQIHWQSHGLDHPQPPFTSRQLMQLVRDSARSVDRDSRNWEATCQLFLALRAATRAYRDNVRIRAHRGQITREQERQCLTECETDAPHLATIQRSLSFAENLDWPRVLDAQPPADLTLSQIAAELARLAERLEQRAAALISLASQ